MRPASLAALHPADDAKLVREIVTPEGIPLRFTLARAGDRAAAFVLDVLAMFVVLAVLGVAAWSAGLASESWLTAFLVIVAFLLFNFYFTFFEVRWQGSTPGKRQVGIRVIDARGGQLETSAVLARNLVRELEAWIPLRLVLAGKLVWPEAPGWATVLACGWAFAFMLMPLFNKDRLRIGDMIAGTRVVMRPKVVLVPDLVDEAAARPHAVAPRHAPALAVPPAYVFSEAQLAIYGVYELQVLEGVLRTGLEDAGHLQAIQTVSAKVRLKIRYGPAQVDDLRFLRDFYAAQRAYLEQKMLFGHRRQDKYAK
jgi:uncharacterized RDD family membrane protein YckC